MSTVLVVDDMPIFREPIAACLRASGYTTFIAGNGQEALTIVRASRPDLILLDMGMPIMDGISFLAVIRGDPKTQNIPVILLTAVTERDHVVQAAKLGVQEYMLKSQFSLRDLLDRVKKNLTAPARPAPPPQRPISSLRPTAASTLAPRGATPPAESPPAAIPMPVFEKPVPTRPAAPTIAADELPRLLTRDDCLARIASTNHAKGLTGVVTQVMAMANSPNSDMSDLADMIMRDPVLAARVLQVANSAAYVSNRGPVTNVDDAVLRVGCSTIRNIAVAVGVFDAVPQASCDGFEPARYLQHSLAVASLCENLVANAPDADKATAYLTGICHDLGEILFFAAFGKEHQQVRLMAAETANPLAELEKRMLGATREDLEVLLFQSLGLPENISRPILAFHAQSFTGEASAASPRTHLLRLADSYANALGLAAHANAGIAAFTCAECRAATGQDHPPRPGITKFRAQILTLTALLGRQPMESDKRAPKSQELAKDVQILLVRAEGLSSFDPVQTALESLAKVTVAPALPHGLVGFCGMVVLAPDSAQKGFTAGDIRGALPPANPGALPTVWIVGRRHASPNQSHDLRSLAWPIPTSVLADFVASLAPSSAYAPATTTP